MVKLFPVKRTDRNGKVVTRWVKCSQGGGVPDTSLPSPSVAPVKDADQQELNSLYKELYEKSVLVAGARQSITYLLEEENLDALRSLKKTGREPSQTVNDVELILHVQGMGISAEEHVTSELADEYHRLKYVYLRAVRDAGSDLKPGTTPLSWHTVGTLLIEDVFRAKTLTRLMSEMKILDPKELRAELARVEEHHSALSEGVL